MKLKGRVQSPVSHFIRILIAGWMALSFGVVNGVMAADGPDLTVDMAHVGVFKEGGSGTFTIVVTNTGNQPTDGSQVAVDIFVDTGAFSVTSIGGIGWTCDSNTLICTRSDVLASALSYGTITLVVDIADDTLAAIDSDASVGGGGEPAGNVNEFNADVDSTPITQVADLIVTKTHIHDQAVDDNDQDPANWIYYDFAEGDQDRTYTITVTNNGDGPTDGSTVTVTDTLPTGLINGTLSGTGWNCIGLTCTRSDVLANGASYPAITLTVDVDRVAPAELTNTVSVDGGGELNTSNNTANDLTTIRLLSELIILGHELTDTTSSHTPLSGAPLADTPFAIKIRVKNQGGNDTGLFYSSVYLNKDVTAAPFTMTADGCLFNTGTQENDWGDYQRPNFNSALPAGATDEEIYVDLINGLPLGTHQIWLYTDPTCVVDESNETNNFYGPITINVTTSGITTGVLLTKSNPTHDGWILETGENTNIGGTKNNAATLLYVGDDAGNRQYVSILSFDTSAIPDNATIVSVSLRFKYAGVTGTLPFLTHGNLLADVRTRPFSNKPTLQPSDFKSAATAYGVLSYRKKAGVWYGRTLDPSEFVYVNKAGFTQFRLRFTKDDNNDLRANIFQIFSGNAPEAYRPKLIVVYTVP